MAEYLESLFLTGSEFLTPPATNTTASDRASASTEERSAPTTESTSQESQRDGARPPSSIAESGSSDGAHPSSSTESASSSRIRRKSECVSDEVQGNDAKRSKNSQRSVSYFCKMSDRPPSPPINLAFSPLREMTLEEKHAVFLYFFRLRINAEVDEVKQFLNSVFHGEERFVLIDQYLSIPYFFLACINDVDVTTIRLGTTFDSYGVSILLDIRARNIRLSRRFSIRADQSVWTNHIEMVANELISFSVYAHFLNYPNYVVPEEFMNTLSEHLISVVNVLHE
ncbi:unnamed protein product [Caenorhabditis bovis]|uniref:Uncharacterized protein n=1 Tax=Caenorhabditis bovis TaxID=2654633 RepID=A0A8S1FF73_9PELO|nr:unnamed protein product [Caenorhabditis bovis]